MARIRTTAVQVNLLEVEGGIEVVAFSDYDTHKRACTEIARFVIPWHEVSGITERLERIETMKVERDAGLHDF